jgi:copper chaperone CopZ
MRITMKIFHNAAIATVLLLTSLAISAETIEMKVNGLVCAFCAQGIEKTLRKQAATQDVFVSLKEGLVAIALKPDADLSDDSLRGLLKEAGYTVVSIQRSETALSELRSKAQP